MIKHVMLPALTVVASLTVAGCGTSSTSHPAAGHTSAVSAPNPTAAPSSAVPSPAATHHARHLGPAATVRAYFKAINRHDYGRAWRLAGRYTGDSYAAFANGFAGTEHDAVTILSVAGHVVRARLAAHQTDGSVKTYEGTYRVNHGAITGSDVAQVFPTAPPPAPSGCTPKTPSGNCYEPGEYCPTADAGMTGVAGDGKTITCVLESGRYHWHPV